MKYYAHSENKKRSKHLLSSHLRHTADIAGSFSEHAIYKKVFRVAGLLHDLGKYQPDFQKYLEQGSTKGSVPHAAWGAGYARALGMIEASIAIDGHHKGIPDRAQWKSDTEPFIRNNIEGFDDVVNSFLNDTEVDEEKMKPPKAPSLTSTERELFIRYLFSVLTDSDWLSTEQHFDEDRFDARTSFILPIEIMTEKLDSELASNQKRVMSISCGIKLLMKQCSRQTCPADFIPWQFLQDWGKHSLQWHGHCNTLKQTGLRE